MNQVRLEHGGVLLDGAPVRRVTAREFRAAFERAFSGSPYTNHVTHYSEGELAGMELFVVQGGGAGVAVHDHGDGRIEATALFNQGGAKGAGLMLLGHVIEHAAVNYVECYGPFLNQLYGKLGFYVESKSAFAPEYAAPGWDMPNFDSPDYYTMRLS